MHLLQLYPTCSGKRHPIKAPQQEGKVQFVFECPILEAGQLQCLGFRTSLILLQQKFAIWSALIGVKFFANNTHSKSAPGSICLNYLHNKRTQKLIIMCQVFCCLMLRVMLLVSFALFSPQSKFSHKEVNNERSRGVCLHSLHAPLWRNLLATHLHHVSTLIPVNSSLLFVYQVRYGIYLQGIITLWSPCVRLSNLKNMKICESSRRHAVAGWCFHHPCPSWHRPAIAHIKAIVYRAQCCNTVY